MSTVVKYRVALGDKVRDTISGFTGVCSCLAIYLNGCRKVLIDGTALNAEGRPLSSWFDEDQVEILKPSWYKSPGLVARQQDQERGQQAADSSTQQQNLDRTGGPVSSLPPS